MEVLPIYSDIQEQKPLIVSACLALKGIIIRPNIVDNLIYNGKLSDLTYEQILDISSYDSAVEFLGFCKEQEAFKFDGTLALVLANYLLRRIAINNSFISEEYDVQKLCPELTALFNRKETMNSFGDYLKLLFSELSNKKILNSDNEAFLYLIVNYFLYSERNQI